MKILQLMLQTWTNSKMGRSTRYLLAVYALRSPVPVCEFGCLSCMCGAQVELMKPLGIKFARGSDGGAYVTRSDPNMGNTDKMVQVYSLLFGVAYSKQSCFPSTSSNEKHLPAGISCQ